MLKSLNFAVFRLEDYYLISTIHAILMNLIKKIKDIHPYTSERIVKSILLLSKKMNKKLALIEKWNKNALNISSPMVTSDDSVVNSPDQISRNHSLSIESIPDEFRSLLFENNSTGNNIQMLYSELAMYKTALTQLLQFSTLLLRY
jgi:hypothetical protein